MVYSAQTVPDELTRHPFDLLGIGAAALAIDEELNVLEDQLRRLKVEYDMYFGGGSKKPPAEIEWKVKTLLKRYSDGARMNYAQRFRYNTIQQRYALYNALWQQKLIIKEEGYRRPQDAVLGIQGIRTDEEHEAAKELKHHATTAEDGPFRMLFSGDSDQKQVESLFQALTEARKKTGEKSSANLDSFKKFVKQKTSQLQKEYGCKAVEYTVELQGGQAKLKAKPK
ncbi:MAG TPA: MXAN_5187 C-terminal domain-containing protein [Candidatus Angelobacter sp.]